LKEARKSGCLSYGDSTSVMKTFHFKGLSLLLAGSMLFSIGFLNLSCEDETTNNYLTDSLVNLYRSFEIEFAVGTTSRKYYSDGTSEKIWGGGYAFGITIPTASCDQGNLSTCWSEQLTSGYAIFHFYKNKKISAELYVIRSLAPTWTYEQMTCSIVEMPLADSTANYVKYYADDGYLYVCAFTCKKYNESTYPYEEVDSTYSNGYSAKISFYK
jgi:hypothetical protein